MSDYKVTDTQLTAIADAIRAKTGGSATLEFPTEFVSEIGSISGGSTLVAKSITANGTYDPTDDNADGYSSVTVNVSGGGSVSSIVTALNNGLEGYPLVPHFTSSTAPDGYTLTYSGQQSGAPAWALFNSTISPVSNGGTSYVRWTASGSESQWVQIELPEAQKINSFYISTVKTTGAGYSFCKTYTIQGSNDGETFDDIYTETLEDDLIGKYVALDSETSAYLYYRIVISDTYYSGYYGLTSFFPMYISV